MQEVDVFLKDFDNLVKRVANEIYFSSFWLYLNWWRYTDGIQFLPKIPEEGKYILKGDATPIKFWQYGYYSYLKPKIFFPYMTLKVPASIDKALTSEGSWAVCGRYMLSLIHPLYRKVAELSAEFLWQKGIIPYSVKSIILDTYTSILENFPKEQHHDVFIAVVDFVVTHLIISPFFISLDKGITVGYHILPAINGVVDGEWQGKVFFINPDYYRELFLEYLMFISFYIKRYYPKRIYTPLMPLFLYIYILIQYYTPEQSLEDIADNGLIIYNRVSRYKPFRLCPPLPQDTHPKRMFERAGMGFVRIDLKTVDSDKMRIIFDAEEDVVKKALQGFKKNGVETKIQ